MLKRNIFIKDPMNLLVIFAGAILPLAFAPFGYYLVAEVALVLLLFAWIKAKSPMQAFWQGWLFGLAFFVCGVYWIYISVHNYGNAPVLLSVFLLLLLVSFLALYFAIQGYLLTRFYTQNNWRKLLLAFPASLVILEWVRGCFLSGFPWLFIGYSHVDSFLKGWATVFGVYGVSFAIALTAGAIVCVFNYRKKIKLQAISALLIVVLWGAGYCLAKIIWVSPIKEPVQVSLIQGDISLERKWEPSELLPIFNSYADLTKQNFSSKIIVWPEAAIPAYPEDVDLYLEQLSLVAKKHHSTIITGILFYDSCNERFYNGMMALGANSGRYYKRNLVPFGEYMPMRFILNWLKHYLIIPMSDFSSGGKYQKDLLLDKTVLAPFVCYEIAYPALVLNYMPRAGLLVTVSDDSWFGESIAAAQHLQIASMRSLEVGRYQLMSTGTGITAIIDDKGKVISQVPAFEQAVLTEDVQILAGATPWVKYGRYLWLLLAVIGLWVARMGHKKP